MHLKLVAVVLRGPTSFYILNEGWVVIQKDFNLFVYVEYTPA